MKISWILSQVLLFEVLADRHPLSSFLASVGLADRHLEETIVCGNSSEALESPSPCRPVSDVVFSALVKEHQQNTSNLMEVLVDATPKVKKLRHTSHAQHALGRQPVGNKWSRKGKTLKALNFTEPEGEPTTNDEEEDPTPKRKRSRTQQPEEEPTTNNEPQEETTTASNDEEDDNTPSTPSNEDDSPSNEGKKRKGKSDKKGSKEEDKGLGDCYTFKAGDMCLDALVISAAVVVGVIVLSTIYVCLTRRTYSSPAAAPDANAQKAPAGTQQGSPEAATGAPGGPTYGAQQQTAYQTPGQ